MFEKVNPMHPDKIADRIAGAIVDAAYKRNDTPKVAVEVLIGHGVCYIINETDTPIDAEEVFELVERIAGEICIDYTEVAQDEHLAENQEHGFRCGDNGIFKGMPVTEEQKELTEITRKIFSEYGTDGKNILADGHLTICQSCAGRKLRTQYKDATVNPLGYWTGGTNVDVGANNRKLGSDMGDSVTGGGLHGKDLSKADVSVNIFAFLRAQASGQPVEMSCSIGDEFVDGIPYSDIVEVARKYIEELGGFEKFAEWGLIR